MRLLRALYLAHNGWTGHLPAWLRDLDLLQYLDLSGNEFDGSPLPLWLGDGTELPRLRGLSLSGNGWTGPIPQWASTDLRYVDLSDNELVGPVPRSFASMAALRSLRLNGNPLTGRLPQVLTGLDHVEELDFAETASVCAPTDAGFDTWLSSIDRWDGARCGGRRLWPRVR